LLGSTAVWSALFPQKWVTEKTFVSYVIKMYATVATRKSESIFLQKYVGVYIFGRQNTWKNHKKKRKPNLL
jgi:hypothetical protein